MKKYVLFWLLMAAPLMAQEEPRDILSIDGYASMAIEPDQVDVVIGVEAMNEDAKIAMNEVASKLQDMFALLEGEGVAPEDMQTTNLDLSGRPIYDEKGETRIGTQYRASNLLRVRIHDIESLPEILSAMAEAGMNQIDGIDFSSSEKDRLNDELLAKAVEDARRRADIAAEAGGMQIVRPISIGVSTERPEPVFRGQAMMRAMDMAESVEAMPVAGGTITIEARASVQFLMEEK